MQLPKALIDSLRGVPGFEECRFLESHQEGKQITSLRINPLKTNSEKAIPLLQSSATARVPWSQLGYYLESRPSFTLDPLFHAGTYYVQEASSMFLEQVFKQELEHSKPIRVLDLCAAPGGKSSHLQSLIHGDSLLVSNEVIKGRVHILTENLTKWGADNVIVTNNDARDFQRLPGFFDVVVVDAPCSGSGLFRKDPAAIKEWSPAGVELCSMRQQRILEDVLPALKEDGLLIYSTCSYSKQENEDTIDWLIEHHQLESIQLNIDKNWNIVESRSEKKAAFGYRFYPDRLNGEGFFMAVFRNKSAHKKSAAVSKKPELLSANQQHAFRSFVSTLKSLAYVMQQEDVLAIPASLIQDFSVIRTNLYIKKAGVCLGQVIRNNFLPHHELAVSSLLSDLVEKMAMDEETAIQYLRKQTLDLSSKKTGWSVVTYQDRPLGWIKILLNRVNNYYPKEWRILNK